MMITFRFDNLAWPDAAAMARPIREQVFVREQRVPIELEWDEWDAVSLHCIARTAENIVIATGRLLPADEAGTARIGRMAVTRDWRGKGVGRGVLLSLLQAAALCGATEIELHAQTHAAGFYRLSGFTQYGEPFEEAGIPHVAMRMTIGPAAL